MAAEAQQPLLGQVARPSADVRQFVSIDTPLVALIGVRVIDGTGRPPLENQVILIKGGRIGAIGTRGRIDIPRGAQALEYADHTVIPGLVGLHNHLVDVGLGLPQQARLYLAGGVTTIRTAGTVQPYRELNLKSQVDAGQLPGPRIFPTGPYLTTERRRLNRVWLQSPQHARRLVDYWAGEGITWFKAYAPFALPELAAIVQAAHSRGRKVTAHICSDQWLAAAGLGIDNLEHGLLGACFERNIDLGSPEVVSLVRRLVQARVVVTSTLVVLEAVTRMRPVADSSYLDLMTNDERRQHLAWRQGPVAASDSLMAEVLLKEMRFERVFASAGGVLVAGTDPVVAGVAPGLADQRNYELLIEAGFGPAEAIRIMTLNGAALLGQSNELGSIEGGKRADLVLIQGDPTVTPEAIRRVVLVFKDGLGYDSPRLLSSVRDEISRRVTP